MFLSFYRFKLSFNTDLLKTYSLFPCFSGIYGVHIKCGDQHIPNSPFMVNISPDSVEAKMVEVHGFKDRGLKVKYSSS